MKRIRIQHKWAAVAATAAVVVTAAVAIPVTTHHVTNQYVAPNTCHANGQLPDPVCTPGATDPRVTQANIGQTICVSGYTATVRPPVSVTSTEKAVSQKQYGYPTGTQGEYDHLIPLELGGSSDTTNLWFEQGSIPNPKDKVENTLKAEVCAGKITLQDAQSKIAKDWTKALN